MNCSGKKNNCLDTENLTKSVTLNDEYLFYSNVKILFVVYDRLNTFYNIFFKIFLQMLYTFVRYKVCGISQVRFNGGKKWDWLSKIYLKSTERKWL
jgi:hypothetical protein